MTDNRTPRTTESREQVARPKAWRPPELLPEPIIQEGYKYRWVRTSTLGVTDQRSITGRFREGWEAVKSSEQPHMQNLIDPNSRFKGEIEISGLLLCKIPKEFVEQRNEYYADQTRRQVEGIEQNYLSQSDARMPVFQERRSTVSFGSGK
jgi:hypothetical protein